VDELFGWRLPLGEGINQAKDWLVSTFSVIWNFIRDLLLILYDALEAILTLPPWWLVIVTLAGLCWVAARRLGLRPPATWWVLGGAAVALLLIDTAMWLLDRLDVEFTPRSTGFGSLALFDLARPSFLLQFLPPSLVMILLLTLLGWAARGWLFALGAFGALVLIDLVALWPRTMSTLAMVIVACGIAALLAIPIGIAAARSRAVSAITKPVLDFMQTMPALVYLVIAVALFRVGLPPGLVATIIFAMPPGIRLTELGIRQVDAEVVEAGHAFGSPPGKILRQIQLPLALPTIMAGINQVIMLALAMVVLAGLAGAGGLGQSVVQGITRLDLGLAIEAGLGVVILAIYLDRTTAALGSRSMAARLQQTA